jgi:hypothetical protein
MSEDLNDFFRTDFNNWNYNPFINNWNYNDFVNITERAQLFFYYCKGDHYNNKERLDPFGYNLMKYNTVITLREILKHTKQYLENDVIEWIIKKAFQGSKNDYKY